LFKIAVKFYDLEGKIASFYFYGKYRLSLRGIFSFVAKLVRSPVEGNAPRNEKTVCIFGQTL